MIVPKRLFLGPRMCLLMCAIAGGASARDAGCDYAAMAEGCTPPTTATTTSSDCKVYMEYEGCTDAHGCSGVSSVRAVISEGERRGCLHSVSSTPRILTEGNVLMLHGKRVCFQGAGDDTPVCSDELADGDTVKSMSETLGKKVEEVEALLNETVNTKLTDLSAKCDADTRKLQIKLEALQAELDLGCGRHCYAGEYMRVACAEGQKTVCAACLKGQWSTGGLAPGCTSCSECPGAEYTAAECTPSADTICKPCTACPDGSYASGGCKDSKDTTHCKPATKCKLGKTWMATKATATSDAVCKPVTVCRKDQAVAAEATMDSDRTCVDDIDGDGYAGEEDCDEGDATVHKGAPELYDGKDNNCDGEGKDGSYGGGVLTKAEYEFTSINGQLKFSSLSTKPVTVYVVGNAVLSGTIDLSGGNGAMGQGWSRVWAKGGNAGFCGGHKGGAGQKASGNNPKNGKRSGEDGDGPGGGIGGLYSSAGRIPGGGGHVKAGERGQNYRYNCNSNTMEGMNGGSAYGKTFELTTGSGGGGGGGGGGWNFDGSGGGGGGGGLAIDAANIKVTGVLRSNGGNGNQNPRYNRYNGNGQCNHDGAPGSGGAGGTLWLRSSGNIEVTGSIEAKGGVGGPACSYRSGHNGCIPKGASGSVGKIIVGPRKVVKKDTKPKLSGPWRAVPAPTVF